MDFLSKIQESPLISFMYLIINFNSRRIILVKMKIKMASKMKMEKQISNKCKNK